MAIAVIVLTAIAVVLLIARPLRWARWLRIGLLAFDARLFTTVWM